MDLGLVLQRRKEKVLQMAAGPGVQQTINQSNSNHYNMIVLDNDKAVEYIVKLIWSA